MIAFVPSAADRAAVTELAQRRFAAMTASGGLVVGDGAELVEHFRARQARGVERCYVWFTDFAEPDTLGQFGAEVIEPLTRALA
jgi:hypothetical protein